jgi:hypothetical protein
MFLPVILRMMTEEIVMLGVDAIRATNHQRRDLMTGEQQNTPREMPHHEGDDVRVAGTLKIY